jgi:hypothetical protein
MKKFVLTKEEKNVLLFVVIAFLLGLTVKIYRDHHEKPFPPKRHAVALLAPSWRGAAGADWLG